MLIDRKCRHDEYEQCEYSQTGKHIGDSDALQHFAAHHPQHARDRNDRADPLCPLRQSAERELKPESMIDGTT